MSIPWIQVYSNLLQHPKTSALADALLLKSSDVNPNVVAAGMLVALWTWAAQNAYNGDLSKCTDRAIADACLYKKSPAALVDALQETGWLDGRKFHEWEQYAALYMNAEDARREKTRDRVRRYRERNGGGNSATV